MKECLVGVDEFSIVLLSYVPVDSKNWIDTSDDMISTFLRQTHIESLFGKLIPLENKRPAGYTYALTVDRVSWYFAIAIHEYYPNMGCLIKFSAEAWAKYQQEYAEYFHTDMNLYEFFKVIQNPLYNVRLSRIDLTADYKNYGYMLTPNYIYDKLKKSEYIVTDCHDRVTRRKMSAIEKDWYVETFYVGSKKENSKLLLRVYDKRQEQISCSGFRLTEALQCDDWTRFEASFRGDYAHQITTHSKQHGVIKVYCKQNYRQI